MGRFALGHSQAVWAETGISDQPKALHISDANPSRYSQRRAISDAVSVMPSGDFRATTMTCGGVGLRASSFRRALVEVASVVLSQGNQTFPAPGRPSVSVVTYTSLIHREVEDGLKKAGTLAQNVR